MKLLGLQSDDKLNFNLHISNIWECAANQLNALIVLTKFINFEEKKILINIYFMANFRYCSLVWILSSASSLKKFKVYSEDYEGPYVMKMKFHTKNYYQNPLTFR